jgi:hypothetical protein
VLGGWNWLGILIVGFGVRGVKFWDSDFYFRKLVEFKKNALSHEVAACVGKIRNIVLPCQAAFALLE